MIRTSNYNIAVVLFVALSSLTYGYGFSIFSTSIGLPGFYSYFNLSSTGERAAYTNHILGAVNSLFSAGAAFGAISVGWLADILGRKRAIILATSISLVGGALVAGSVAIPMFVVMRFIQGIGLGMNITLTPIYLTEVAPPHIRGRLAGQSAVGQVCGYFLSSWVGYGCYFATNETFAWRFPLALSCLTPLILLVGMYWIPESPRWLLLKDRAEEAWTITQRLHHDPDDEQELHAKEEFYQMQMQIEFDKTRDLSMWYMLKTPNLRKRILMGAGCLLGGQACGVLVINNYNVILYESLGLHGSLPLLMYAIYVIVGSLANVLASFIMDRVGRRRLLVTGFTLVLICLIFECALVATFLNTDNKGGNAAAVFFLFLYEAIYGTCIDNTAYVFCAEIFPTTYRAKGYSIGLFVFFTSSIAFLTPAATAFANIGWKFYLVFVVGAFLAAVLTYWYIPETSRKSLEEINEIFGDPVIVHVTNATAEEKEKLDEQIKAKENVTMVENTEP